MTASKAAFNLSPNRFSQEPDCKEIHFLLEASFKVSAEYKEEKKITDGLSFKNSLLLQHSDLFMARSFQKVKYLYSMFTMTSTEALRCVTLTDFFYLLCLENWPLILFHGSEPVTPSHKTQFFFKKRIICLRVRLQWPVAALLSVCAPWSLTHSISALGQQLISR